MFKNKTIFIAPLDWGLGHATRCVPLVKKLSEHNRIILGVTPLIKPVFDQEFPEMQQVILPSYGIAYSRHIPLWLKLLADSGRIKRIIRKEHELLKTIVSGLSIDVVISDNRFGMHHNSAHSVFITHQLSLKTPVFKGLVDSINRGYINRFGEVWIPDYESDLICLSGDLSHHIHGVRVPVRYIDPQSRMIPDQSEYALKYDYLVLLSGPEPQRSLLENLLITKFRTGSQRVMFIRGTTTHEELPAGIDFLDFASSPEISALVKASAKVICRSGYSTLMDMHQLGKKELILVPTPGQAEQEYLAEYWQKKFGAAVLLQKNIRQSEL